MWDTVFDKIGLDFHFKKSALKLIEMWDAIFNWIGFLFKKKGMRILDSMFDSIWFDFCRRIVPGKCERNP